MMRSARDVFRLHRAGWSVVRDRSRHPGRSRRRDDHQTNRSPDFQHATPPVRCTRV